ncbi:MAG: nodulation protein NodJ [Porticoccaceae bacterium]|jgi:lipooligosaccharide transport system permease protein|nr:nodulation protein NodJ [Porticoccaceae bacterium]
MSMLAPPRPSFRSLAVWQRNLRVWRKMLLPSTLGNFGEPLLYLLAFGYGFGQLVGDLGQLPYVAFLASGIICSSALFTASFEAMYSAFTRMANQQTWNAMLNAPLVVDDIVLGEVLWAATKGLMSATAILLVAAAMGLVADWRALWALPVVALSGFAFAACAMVVTAFARSYDFFLYFFTLILTPMLLTGGVFFPREQFPEWLQRLAYVLPLPHAVDLVRPLLTGGSLHQPWLNLAVVVGYGLVGLVAATALIRRRMVC